ncbi:MAG: SLC13 family permease [Rhodospirillales bacterium]|nr:SLC13 family permease [Rhodospirillales bacterium]
MRNPPGAIDSSRDSEHSRGSPALPVASEQILIFAILGGALAAFASGRLRFDVVAVVALLAAVTGGVVPASEAFSGFGHPAVITVAAVLILSRALQNAGIVELAARLLKPLAETQTRQVLALTAMAAVCSAFMNNVGALALLLPVALRTAGAAGRPASQLLMPLSFGSLLGGLTTLIGTPPNIIIANFRAAETGQAFAMFDFAPVGITLALAGIAFIGLFGWRLLPLRHEQRDETVPHFDIEGYITEARLPEGSPYVGRRLVDLEALGQGDASVVALERRGDPMLAPSAYLSLQAGDILILRAGTGGLKRVVEEAALDRLGSADLTAANLRSEQVGLSEAVITQGSRLEGRTARGLRLHTRFGVNLLGVSRQGQQILERVGRVPLKAGDVLLLQGERAALPDTLASLGCLPLAARDIEIAPPGAGPLAPAVFGIAVLLTAFGIAAPQIAFVAAVAVLVLAGKITLRQLYDWIDWPIVVLLGALIPVGAALEATGGSAVIARPILALGGQAPLWVVLALLMAVTMLLSDIMNNAATAVLMAPIGITIAQGLGLSVDPFLMAVAVGASSTYLTPIGHQSNLLVMGPGGYHFGDYWRMGLPLDLILIAVAVPMILLVWPA